MTMKYLMLLASFVGAYVAQRIDITLPAFDTNVFSGQNITVQISQNVTDDPSLNEILILSMAPCDPSFPTTDCSSPSYDPSQRLDVLLYNGPYDPQHYPMVAPYENFTVQVPDFAVSQASLIATHFFLAGIGPQPVLELKYVVLNITNPV